MLGFYLFVCVFFEDIFIQQIHPLYLFCVKAILLLFIPSTSNTVLAYDISFEFGWVGEKFKRYGTYVYLGLILINIWKKPILYCGVITLKLKINKFKKKRSCPCPWRHCILKRERSIKKNHNLKLQITQPKQDISERFMEIQFTYHKIHLYKVWSSVILNIYRIVPA